MIEPLNIPCQVRVSGFSQRCNSFTHSLTPYLPHSLFPSHSPSHSPSHYLLPRRTRSEHHIASSGCRLQTTVSCETSVKNGRWRKVCAVRVTKFARPTGYHLELTPGLNYYRKNPKCGQTVWGINMKSVRNI